MPEESVTESDLLGVVNDLEDYTLNIQNYKTLQSTLDAVDHITAQAAEKLLSLCIRNGIEDLKYAAHTVNIISTLIKKTKNGECTSLPNFLPSALAVLNLLTTSVLCTSIEALKTLCLEVIVSYPDETLISLGVNHSKEIFELINLYSLQLMPCGIMVMALNLIGKLLKILPPDEKATFVKCGIDFWLSSFIPTVVKMTTETTDITKPMVISLLESLELLTDELVKYDYINNRHWYNLFENIYSAKRYPALIKDILEKGCDYWHRLWIVFIKLLKNQITTIINGTASPINVLLRCVETAFKMDIGERCRAFLCWNALINIFSKETNETLLNKRLKLLMVPLAANNARIEETVVAKFNTWWHLIICFQSKMDKFLEVVVIPFLSFCFGKPGTNILIPGKISEKTKIQCVQAFINLVGHTECEGCVLLPKLNVKVLNTMLLVNHWKKWIHYLGSVISICVEQRSKQQNLFSDVQIKCVWRSFILTIAEMPDNNIRRDLFNETLMLLDGLTEDDQFICVIVNVLIPTLFENNDNLKSLLKAKDEQNAPSYKIINIINKLPLDSLEDRRTAINNIKLITNWMMCDAIKTSNKKLECYVNMLSPQSMVQWTALAEAVQFSDKKKDMCPNMLTKIFLWPLKYMHNFVTIEESTAAWLNLLNASSPNLQIQSIHTEIFKALLIHKEDQSSSVFVLSAVIALLKQKLRKEVTDFHDEIIMIVQLTSKFDEQQMKAILPSLASIIVKTINSLRKNANKKIAEQLMLIINNIMRVFCLIMKEHSDNGNLVKYLENIFTALQTTLNLEWYTNLKLILVDQLKECAPYFKKENILVNHILSIYNISPNKDVSDHIGKELIEAFNGESSSLNQAQKQKTVSEKFIIPSSKVGKESKKEASIINTVVENGEEFVVVKSNWKFNPRKLTDNQKEKLQRQREDIPALYQDLSQSQDQFKLTTWKTDSQDTSTTTSSKSTNTVANEDVSLILKNIPNSDFIPKIIENVLVKPEKTEKQINVNIDKPEKNKTSNVNCVKDSKSPRMALKDRVFRNMRNLIENSNVGHESNVISSNNTENGLKTPLTNKVRPSTNVTNSAPSQINSDRPSRVKRKPKKFDDLQLISLGKRRHSLNTVDCENDADINEKSNSSKCEKMDIETDQNVKCPKSIDNTESSSADISNIKSSKPDESNKLEDKSSETNHCVTVNQMIVHNNGKDAVDPNISSPLINQINETDKTSSTHDVNNMNHSPMEIKEKIKETLCIGDNHQEPSSLPSKTKKNKDKEPKITTDSKNTGMFTPRSRKRDANEKDKNHPDNMLTGETKERVDEQTCTADNTNTDAVLNKQTHSNKKYKSRIESQLAIDMVEGHPFLKAQSEKRATRKSIINSPRKKRLSFNSENAKLKRKGICKLEKRAKDKEKVNSVIDSPNKEDISASQDFIESSQDSTVTTISVKASKLYEQLTKVVQMSHNEELNLMQKQNLTDAPVSIDLTNVEDNSDIELPCNKTNLSNLTEEMDTQPIDCKNIIDLSKDEDLPSVSVVSVGMVSLEKDTADVDTEPVDPDMSLKTNDSLINADTQVADITKTNELTDKTSETVPESSVNNDVSLMATADDLTATLSASVLMEVDKEDSSSACNNDQRKKDFFDNTLQISPIKSMSPVREQESPSPETSSDFVLIKLSSPVQSNGEPFDVCESPEVFTEDKVSPDKRERSPPREPVTVKNTSPSSALSLKRNRPQMRPGGRAAQMLGLCVPDRLQTLMTEKPVEAEEPKRSPSLNTSARRNLKILYHNTSGGENTENVEDNEDNENFLKFKRTLPTTDCSPSGPILKRKLIDIADESLASPASKRKRVSFHDPPVSTTICVKKYIEPISIRSPQNSVTKRLERQARAQIAIKSPRRLDNVFKLDSILLKAVESFSDETQSVNEDTEMSSLDETPIVEVVKAGDLNDTDPVCKELADCDHRIDNIAAELSSPAMKEVLVKNFEGIVETVGDLARMTELEINRLSIKAPKVQVAKNALYEYLSKMNRVSEEITPTLEAAMSESTVLEAKANIEVQTDSILLENIEMQTEEIAVSLGSTQTDTLVTSNNFAQTDGIESNCTTKEPNLLEMCEKLDELSKKKLAEDLSHDTLIKIVMEKINNGDGTHVLSVLQDQLVKNLQCKDLILFCSSLLRKVYDKPT